MPNLYSADTTQQYQQIKVFEDARYKNGIIEVTIADEFVDMLRMCGNYRGNTGKEIGTYAILSEVFLLKTTDEKRIYLLAKKYASSEIGGHYNYAKFVAMLQKEKERPSVIKKILNDAVDHINDITRDSDNPYLVSWFTASEKMDKLRRTDTIVFKTTRLTKDELEQNENDNQ